MLIRSNSPINKTSFIKISKRHFSSKRTFSTKPIIKHNFKPNFLWNIVIYLFNQLFNLFFNRFITSIKGFTIAFIIFVINFDYIYMALTTIFHFTEKISLLEISLWMSIPVWLKCLYNIFNFFIRSHWFNLQVSDYANAYPIVNIFISFFNYLKTLLSMYYSTVFIIRKVYFYLSQILLLYSVIMFEIDKDILIESLLFLDCAYIIFFYVRHYFSGHNLNFFDTILLIIACFFFKATFSSFIILIKILYQALINKGKAPANYADSSWNNPESSQGRPRSPQPPEPGGGGGDQGLYYNQDNRGKRKREQYDENEERRRYPYSYSETPANYYTGTSHAGPSNYNYSDPVPPSNDNRSSQVGQSNYKSPYAPVTRNYTSANQPAPSNLVPTTTPLPHFSPVYRSTVPLELRPRVINVNYNSGANSRSGPVPMPTIIPYPDPNPSRHAVFLGNRDDNSPPVRVRNPHFVRPIMAHPTTKEKLAYASQAGPSNSQVPLNAYASQAGPSNSQVPLNASSSQAGPSNLQVPLNASSSQAGPSNLQVPLNASSNRDNSRSQARSHNPMSIKNLLN